MKKYLLAATLIGAFAAPVLAMDSYYIVFDKTTKTCSMSRSAPTDTEKFSMMGTYGSEADAKMAMAGMTRCNKH
jgi:hypothetical protein